MKKDFSPEEKLLRLIKGSGKKYAPKDSAETKAALPQSGAPAYYKSDDSHAVRAASVFPPFKIKDINTKGINPVFAVILIGLLLYLAFDLISMPYSKKEVNIISGIEQEPAAARGKAASAIEPYSYYSSQIESKNIFSSQESETSTAVSGPSLEEVSSNLSLIGIIAGDRPQAIIEDKKAGKSIFLYKGGLVGQAKIVDILDDKVVMEYNGQTFELML
ncbi:MAG: type II secretion system protein N [Candidatus Omnitrophica bacterium]|nr:type II secretion system protein N [Candidatus Omnitrophota bacterium]